MIDCLECNVQRLVYVRGYFPFFSEPMSCTVWWNAYILNIVCLCGRLHRRLDFTECLNDMFEFKITSVFQCSSKDFGMKVYFSLGLRGKKAKWLYVPLIGLVYWKLINPCFSRCSETGSSWKGNCCGAFHDTQHDSN